MIFVSKEVFKHGGMLQNILDGSCVGNFVMYHLGHKEMAICYNNKKYDFFELFSEFGKYIVPYMNNRNKNNKIYTEIYVNGDENLTEYYCSYLDYKRIVEYITSLPYPTDRILLNLDGVLCVADIHNGELKVSHLGDKYFDGLLEEAFLKEYEFHQGNLKKFREEVKC